MKTIDCNLLDAPADVIGHCCNCQNTMGSGVAAAIKKKYPEAYDVDCQTWPADTKKLGNISLAVINNPDNQIKAVANLYGQYGYGGDRPLNYEAIYTALETLKKRLKPAIKAIAFPYKMGSDRAGGSWPIVEKMIEVVFENSGFDVIICKFDPTTKL